jgi:methylthioribose-1-phosphate isomerase
MSSKFTPIQFLDHKLLLLDQRKLPLEENFIEYTTLEGGHDGIRDMVVRGAPCIGFTAIFALALWLRDREFTADEFESACLYLNSARPTAVNLAFEIEQVKMIVSKALAEKASPYPLVVEYGHKQIELSMNSLFSR